MTLVRFSVLASALAAALISTSGFSASAAEDTAVAVSTGTTFELPITRGHHMYDATAFYTNIGQDFTNAGVFVSNEYFLIDHLSLGGGIGLFWQDSPFSKSSVTLSLSPSATFYFLQMGAWTPFVNQRVGYSDSGRWSGSTSLGARYFFNPHVAFSPRISVDYYERGTGSANFNAGFSLFY